MRTRRSVRPTPRRDRPSPVQPRRTTLRDVQAPTPARRQPTDIRCIRRTEFDDLQTSRLITLGQSRRVVVAGQGRVRRRVALRCRQKDNKLAAIAEARRDAVKQAPICGQKTAQERAPGQRDGDQVGHAHQRTWQQFRRGADEDGVGQAAASRWASGLSRGIGHRSNVRVDADHELARILSSAAQHSLARACPQIDRHALVAADQLVQLADVYVEESLADHLSHGRYSSHEEEPALIRFVLVCALVAACTASVPPGATPVPTSAPASITPTTAPATTAVQPTAVPTVAPTTAPGSTTDPYYNPDDKYTPRPTAGAQATPVPLVVGVSGYFIDPDGMALYTFDNDSLGEATCLGGCADNWPPLTVAPDQEVTAGAGVLGTLATIERTDGLR